LSGGKGGLFYCRPRAALWFDTPLDMMQFSFDHSSWHVRSSCFWFLP